MREFTLWYDDTPPSLNTLAHAHWTKFRKAKRRWQDILATLMLAERQGIASPVFAQAELRFPTRRRRDEGNYRALLEKSLGDALVEGGYIPDDTPEHFRFGAVVINPDLGPNRTTIVLRCG